MVLVVIQEKTLGGFLRCILCVHLYNWFTEDYKCN